VDDKVYFGCTVGRVTNRIKNGCFQLDNIVYQLEKNENGKHHLHDVGYLRSGFAFFLNIFAQGHFPS